MCLLVHFYTSPHPAPALPLQPSVMLHSFLLQVLGYYPASSFKKLSEQEGTCFLWSFVINSQLTCFLPVLRLGKVQSCGFYTSPISSSYWHYQSLTIFFFFESGVMHLPVKTFTISTLNCFVCEKDTILFLCLMVTFQFHLLSIFSRGDGGWKMRLQFDHCCSE